MEQTEKLIEFLVQECGLVGEPVGHAVTRLLVQLLEALPAYLDDEDHVRVLHAVRSFVGLELLEIEGETMH
jgi:hypothetical protein